MSERIRRIVRDAVDRASSWVDRLDADCIEPDAGRAPTVVVLVTAAVALTFIRYAATAGTFERLTGIPVSSSDDAQLAALVWWGTISIAGYVAIPLVAIRAFGLGSIRDIGVSWRGLAGRMPAYVTVLLLTLLIVGLVSRWPSFQAVYPFYKPAELSVAKLVLFELVYGAQFFALEFFFRGFLIHIPKRRLGSLAVFVMMIPYCMIHFRKPLPETIGAILGGTVLGYASLRTGSIAGGIFLHLGVAWGMDTFALWNAR